MGRFLLCSAIWPVVISLAACTGTPAPTDAADHVDAVDLATDTPRADVTTPTDATNDTGTDTGATDVPTMPSGSSGCGLSAKGGPFTMTIGADTMEYIVSIPSGYDSQHPYPLGFGLHGANRTGENCMQGDCAGFQSELGTEAILVYPRSISAGWQDDASIRTRNHDLFVAILDRVLANYCVETGRVFVAGTSSGATFANHLGCSIGDRLRAVIPVAGGTVDRSACVGRPAALVIHGVDDPHVLFSYGETMRDAYRMTNGCSAETTPVIADLHSRVVANRESHECADYVGCNTGLPVRWCEHSEGGYDGSTHGWPLFGGAEIRTFVWGL